MLRAFWAAALGLAACRHARPDSAPAMTLAGHTFPLASGMATAGQVGGRPAEVVLDIARPVTAVSEACFEGAPPRVEGTLRVPEVSGGEAEWQLVQLEGVRVGAVTLASQLAGLTGEKGCTVTLGQDVLGGYAMTLDPGRREVRFSVEAPGCESGGAEPGGVPSGRAHPSNQAERSAAESKPQGNPATCAALKLEREPRTDWLLVSARITQGSAELIAPFVLTSREPRSLLATALAAGQGLRGVPGSKGRPVYPQLRLDFADGLAVGPIALDAGSRWARPGLAGRMGPDVWGRFLTTIDLRTATLVLRSLPGATRPADSDAALPLPSKDGAPPAPPEPEPDDPW